MRNVLKLMFLHFYIKWNLDYTHVHLATFWSLKIQKRRIAKVNIQIILLLINKTDVIDFALFCSVVRFIPFLFYKID